jgi:heme/copper-type cytochrome/quinol oxidase subunit 3
MRFPNDTAFHLRMAALLIVSMFLEHLATTRLQHWSSPQIGVITFVLGLAWVALAAYHHAKATQERMRALEAKVERLQAHVDALADGERARRSLPPM